MRWDVSSVTRAWISPTTLVRKAWQICLRFTYLLSVEFTTLEFYMAYADVYDLMDMTEELVAGLVHHIHGSYKTKFHTAKGEEIEINWEAPWRRIEMIPTLEELVGEKFPPGDQLHTAETGE